MRDESAYDVTVGRLHIFFFSSSEVTAGLGVPGRYDSWAGSEEESFWIGRPKVTAGNPMMEGWLVSSKKWEVGLKIALCAVFNYEYRGHAQN